MSSVQHLREFIRERLTAAVEEIFTEFDKTIVLFEKEIDHHRRLLDTCKKKAQINFHTAERPQQHVYKQEDVPMDQQLCNQERDCSLDHTEPELSQIKDMQVEFWNRQEDEHLLKKDMNSFMMHQGKSICEETSESSIIDLEENLDDQHRPSQINFNTPEPPQEHLAEEDELWNHQQLHDHNRYSSLDQDVQTRVLQQNNKEQEKPEPPQVNEYHEEPEPLQVKEEQDFFSIQDEEQLVLKEETEVLIINYDDCDSIKSEPTSTQLLSHSSASSPLREESSLDTDETPYVCKTCGKRFSDLTSANFHQKTHEEEKPFSCETCLKRFGRRDSMLRHMITHTGERPYSCQICGDKFGLNSHLLRHMRTHTGEKPFTCEICHKSFTQSNSLTYHMRIHTDERPHSCKECGKSFKQTGALKTHLRTHTNEKPYSCNVCGKSLRSSTSLMCHMRTHTGEKPYSCKICGRGFTQTGALNVHLRTHTNEKPYSCSMCGKCLRTKTSLQYHIRTHTGEKPYSCKICAKRFSQSSHLFLHMKSSHR